MRSRQVSKKGIVLLIDIVAITISFLCALYFRYSILNNVLGSELPAMYIFSFFVLAILIYILFFGLKKYERPEKQSYKELIFAVLEFQTFFISYYIVIFFAFHVMYYVSRLFVGVFFVGNVCLCVIGRIAYRSYCCRKPVWPGDSTELSENDVNSADLETNDVQHVYIIGSKSIGMYGGYETFVMNLLNEHKENPRIKYHIACKANGSGYMEVKKLPGAQLINDDEFTYCNAHCFLLRIPEKIGAAQAIYYDLKALEYAVTNIEHNHIPHAIVYILASRIGPFERKYVKRIHAAGGRVFHNPDGHEDKRGKWNAIIRKYWKLSEKYAVKNADLIVCDSKNIESYIKEEYAEYKPKTTFIAYGSYITEKTNHDNPVYKNWLADHNLRDGEFYVSVGRFVPENNFETMLREFMRSNTKRDFAIITTIDEKFAAELQQKLEYKKDSRIKFVGTVYDPELLSTIRSNACGYLHGHEVGGTNPSLLEALGSTNVNLLYDVGFNREVGEDSALYWTKDEGSLADLIEQVDAFSASRSAEMGEKAKARIKSDYSWEYICKKYEDAFTK